ncbi:GIY-YIG nuclease family protein [Mucilaginibacter glaciei]|uniref:GIY-YIG nuclease family protein n=1 Tax=Mucilaginibacter glaciei TaxID=2772109 RepID=UPI001CD0F7C2
MNKIFSQGGSVYIMTNRYHNVLYTGVTSELVNRIWQHKNNVYPNSFTAKYKCIS